MNKSFHIGIDGRLYFQTGVGRYIRNLIRELSLRDRKNRYTLFVRSEDKEAIAIEQKNISMEVVDSRWHSLDEQIRLPGILSRYNLDLIHFPYFSFPIRYRGTFVVTIHDLTPRTYVTGKASTFPWPMYQLKQIGYRFVIQSAISRACHILVPTDATASLVTEFYPEAKGKITVTQEGANIVDITTTRAPLEVNSPFFLYVGNAYPHKNLEGLIQAFIEMNMDAVLVVVGKEDFFMKKIKMKYKHPRVIFFGEATDRELGWFYKHAQALVFPSHSEGFGLPALEAMMYGCPVAASNIPSLQEICGDCAVYMDPANKGSIQKALQHVSEREVKEKLTVCGQVRAKQFTWNQMAEKTLSVYEHCLSLRSSK